jgi:hypothetical protein
MGVIIAWRVDNNLSEPSLTGSAGSSSASEWTRSGESSASWSAILAPDE